MPSLVVVLAFGGLLVGEEFRVERTWVAGDPAGYLSVGRSGQVDTYPPANQDWTPASKLSDVSPDGSLLAQAEGDRVAIYPGAGAGGEGGRASESSGSAYYVYSDLSAPSRSFPGRRPRITMPPT